MILDEIILHRKEQLAREKAACAPAEMKARAEAALDLRKPVSLKKALQQDTLSCICEVKKASPSKGLICPDFHPVEIAETYEKAGANAISCLTEEHYFQGSSQYLAAIRKAVSLPILRKDFIFDEYQIYEAAAIGADAVLLIAAVLEPQQLAELYHLAYDLGLEVLVEVHSREELEGIAFLQPEILGVNNRNLKTFAVSLDTVAQLKPFAPADAVFVSESGIRNNGDMKQVRALGADAVLIGETLMRSGDIPQTLAELREGV
ncbi:indole-3-glycerol phosphate synthase TrpC [uncultured Ruminococcus sp.]|uniref:indole-3-glycerol phosphate synthase TrpC n=1 Tax=uncultured Ruminococcus sp. TaxID=165186 RepID=UPI002609F46F|nr:indole-3-glycerol phosphate synthase TrpC [uncultured Ruminococcus sp.]